MTEAKNPAQNLVDEEFPESLRPLVPQALKRAYRAADELIQRTDFLNNPSGRFQRGDLICKAAEHEFKQLIEAGVLPFDMSWEDYAAPTGKHLVIHGRRSLITLNQVESIDAKPRSAVFRCNYGASNMEYLWPEWNEEARQVGEKKHIVLLHGYQELNFASFGLPHPKRNLLIWRTPNLLPKPHEAENPQAGRAEEGPPESPGPDDLEDLIKFIRDPE